MSSQEWVKQKFEGGGCLAQLILWPFYLSMVDSPLPFEDPSSVAGASMGMTNENQTVDEIK